VYWNPVGTIDVASLKEKVPLPELIKYHLQVMEFNQQVYFRQFSNKLKRTVHNCTCVLDLHEFSVRNLTKSFREVVSVVSIIDRDYYYDNFKRVIILSAPLPFRLFWKSVSLLIRAETKAKFLFLDRREDLTKYVDPALTPVRFGGCYIGSDALVSKGSTKTFHYDLMDKYIQKLQQDSSI